MPSQGSAPSASPRDEDRFRQEELGPVPAKSEDHYALWRETQSLSESLGSSLGIIDSELLTTPGAVVKSTVGSPSRLNELDLERRSTSGHIPAPEFQAAPSMPGRLPSRPASGVPSTAQSTSSRYRAATPSVGTPQSAWRETRSHEQQLQHFFSAEPSMGSFAYSSLQGLSRPSTPPFHTLPQRFHPQPVISTPSISAEAAVGRLVLLQREQQQLKALLQNSGISFEGPNQQSSLSRSQDGSIPNTRAASEVGIAPDETPEALREQARYLREALARAEAKLEEQKERVPRHSIEQVESNDVLSVSRSPYARSRTVPSVPDKHRDDEEPRRTSLPARTKEDTRYMELSAATALAQERLEEDIKELRRSSAVSQDGRLSRSQSRRGSGDSRRDTRQSPPVLDSEEASIDDSRRHYADAIAVSKHEPVNQKESFAHNGLRSYPDLNTVSRKHEVVEQVYHHDGINRKESFAHNGFRMEPAEQLRHHVDAARKESFTENGPRHDSHVSLARNGHHRAGDASDWRSDSAVNRKESYAHNGYSNFDKVSQPDLSRSDGRNRQQRDSSASSSQKSDLFDGSEQIHTDLMGLAEQVREERGSLKNRNRASATIDLLELEKENPIETVDLFELESKSHITKKKTFLLQHDVT